MVEDIEDRVLKNSGFAPDSKDILTAEFEQLSAAFLQNEQSGEARLNIFLLLAGALGAFGFSESRDNLLSGSDATARAACLLLVIALIGWFTLIRLIHRNRTTDDYLNRMSRVRRGFLAFDHRLSGFLPFPANARSARELHWGEAFVPHRAGLVELTCWINAPALAGSAFLFAYVAGGTRPWVNAAAALIVLILVLALQMVFVRKKYREPLRSDTEDHKPDRMPRGQP